MNPIDESLYQQIPAPTEATRERLEAQGRLRVTHRPHCLRCDIPLANSCGSSHEAQKAVEAGHCSCGQFIGHLVGCKVLETFWRLGTEAGEVG